jgi:hypothetical protein
MEFTDMATTEVRVQRFTLVSPKIFSEVLAAIEAGLGHPDLRQFHQNMAAARSWDDLERVIAAAVGPCGLMEFARFDFGMVLQKAQSGPAPRILRIILGHPLIMRQIAAHVPDAGSYVPVTILIDERADGVHLSYDLIESYLAPYGNADAREIAHGLDSKVKALLEAAAG